jgi:nitrite reductase/ring-hydroxylating ferredoxin subunit
MSEENRTLARPDLTKGIPIADLAEGGMILGQVAGEAVVLAHDGGALFAIGAECTH